MLCNSSLKIENYFYYTNKMLFKIRVTQKWYNNEINCIYVFTFILSLITNCEYQFLY